LDEWFGRERAEDVAGAHAADATLLLEVSRGPQQWQLAVSCQTLNVHDRSTQDRRTIKTVLAPHEQHSPLPCGMLVRSLLFRPSVTTPSHDPRTNLFLRIMSASFFGDDDDHLTKPIVSKPKPATEPAKATADAPKAKAVAAAADGAKAKAEAPKVKQEAKTTISSPQLGPTKKPVDQSPPLVKRAAPTTASAAEPSSAKKAATGSTLNAASVHAAVTEHLLKSSTSSSCEPAKPIAVGDAAGQPRVAAHGSTDHGSRT